jgi:ABC-2 type transport system ATP-binding protein
MTKPSIVRLENISKSFTLRHNRSLKETAIHRIRGGARDDAFDALKDISLDIHTGTTVGLVGHNGSGKSTLLKVIGGIIAPDSGVAMRRGRLAALLELGAGFHPDLTGRENIFLNAAILGLTRSETARRMDAIVDFAEIEQFLDNQVKFYSSGMYVRLGFAVAVHTDPDLLLVDEVLAVGDEPFQRKCIDRIRDFQREGRTIVVVSHSASQIRELCSRVVVLDHGEMRFNGPTDDGLDVLSELYAHRKGHLAHERSDSAGSNEPVRLGAIRSSVERHGDDVDVAVDVEFEVAAPVSDWAIKVSFLSATGQVVTDVDNLLVDTQLPSTPGKYTVRYEYPNAPLGVGSYDIHVLAAARGGVPLYHSVADAAHIQIPPGRRGEGLVRMYPQITVTT